MLISHAFINTMQRGMGEYSLFSRASAKALENDQLFLKFLHFKKNKSEVFSYVFPFD